MQKPVLKKELKRKRQITVQMISGKNEYVVMSTAERRLNGCQKCILNSSKTVRRYIEAKEIINLNRETFVFERIIGKKITVYPIKTPIQAVKNQDSPLVYIAQVNKRRQIDM